MRLFEMQQPFPMFQQENSPIRRQQCRWPFFHSPKGSEYCFQPICLHMEFSNLNGALQHATPHVDLGFCIYVYFCPLGDPQPQKVGVM